MDIHSVQECVYVDCRLGTTECITASQYSKVCAGN